MVLTSNTLVGYALDLPRDFLYASSFVIVLRYNSKRRPLEGWHAQDHQPLPKAPKRIPTSRPHGEIICLKKIRTFSAVCLAHHERYVSVFLLLATSSLIYPFKSLFEFCRFANFLKGISFFRDREICYLARDLFQGLVSRGVAVVRWFLLIPIQALIISRNFVIRIFYM